MNYTHKSTPELQIGDIVAEHGARFRLTEYIVGPHNVARYDRDHTLRAFRTEFLGSSREDGTHAIPPAWIPEWTIQGNSIARWRVETP